MVRSLFVLAVGLTLLSACDATQEAPQASVSVEFKQTLPNGDKVSIGAFDVQDEVISLASAFDTTLTYEDEDPSSLSIRPDMSDLELSSGSRVFLLYPSSPSGVVSGAVEVASFPALLPPTISRNRSTRSGGAYAVETPRAVSVAGAPATAGLRVFALVEPGGYARGPFSFEFDDQEVVVGDISDYAIVAPPALDISADDLDWQGSAKGLSFSVDRHGEMVRMLSSLQEQCPDCEEPTVSSYLGGYENSIYTPTSDSFRYRLFLIER